MKVTKITVGKELVEFKGINDNGAEVVWYKFGAWRLDESDWVRHLREKVWWTPEVEAKFVAIQAPFLASR